MLSFRNSLFLATISGAAALGNALGSGLVAAARGNSSIESALPASAGGMLASLGFPVNLEIIFLCANAFVYIENQIKNQQLSISTELRR